MPDTERDTSDVVAVLVRDEWRRHARELQLVMKLSWDALDDSNRLLTAMLSDRDIDREDISRTRATVVACMYLCSKLSGALCTEEFQNTVNMIDSKESIHAIEVAFQRFCAKFNR